MVDGLRAPGETLAPWTSIRPTPATRCVPRTVGVVVIDTVIGVTWIVFWIYWLAAAAGAKRARTSSRAHFGVSYPQYKRSTKMLIPFVF